MCVSACVSACARACVRVCVRVFSWTGQSLSDLILWVFLCLKKYQLTHRNAETHLRMAWYMKTMSSTQFSSELGNQYLKKLVGDLNSLIFYYKKGEETYHIKKILLLRLLDVVRWNIA